MQLEQDVKVILIHVFHNALSISVCPAGTYRSLLDPPRVCITCPTNTVSNVVGASICRCLAGHYRRASQLNCQRECMAKLIPVHVN